MKKHEKAPVSTSKHRTTTKPSLAFRGILSSDSDSDFENKPPPRRNILNGKPTKLTDIKAKQEPIKTTIKLCSDSDDDDDRGSIKDPDYCVEDSMTAVTGKVSESPDFKIPGSLGSNSGRSSMCIDAGYNYTVVKNRESIASMTFDLDQLGEPLVESTRIHRRSSASFKQIFEKLDEEDCVKNAEDTLQSTGILREKINNDIEGIDKVLKGLELKSHYDRGKETTEAKNALHDENEMYVTAMEILDMTSSSTGSEETNRKKVKDSKSKKSSKSKKASTKQILILADSESEDEIDDMIEVVDAGTQTVDVGCKTEGLSELKVYGQETVLDDCDESTKGEDMAYEQDTEVIGEDSAIKQAIVNLANNPEIELGQINKNASVDCQSHVNDFDENTEIGLVNGKSFEAAYKDDTNILDPELYTKYKNDTANNIEHQNKVDKNEIKAYNEDTLEVSDDESLNYGQITLNGNSGNSCKRESNDLDNENAGDGVNDRNSDECDEKCVSESTDNSTSSDESEYEVLDVATQTEPSEDQTSEMQNEINLNTDDVEKAETTDEDLNNDTYENGANSDNEINDEEAENKSSDKLDAGDVDDAEDVDDLYVESSEHEDSKSDTEDMSDGEMPVKEISFAGIAKENRKKKKLGSAAKTLSDMDTNTEQSWR